MTDKPEKLSLLMMETDEGIFFEVYKKPDVAEAAFDNLHGGPLDAPSRATFLTLDWSDGFTVNGKSVELPKPQKPKDDEPWAYVLGEGPIEEPEENDKSEKTDESE